MAGHKKAKMKKGILSAIKERRSIRKFKKTPVSRAAIKEILEAGRWAPSGLNNQPWRFSVLEKEAKNALVQFTKYASLLRGADKAVLIFFDKQRSYNYEKDLMAVGACAQNMLLCAHALGVGACWLGEILNQRKKIEVVFDIDKSLELEAVIALGLPGENGASRRRSLNSLKIKIKK